MRLTVQGRPVQRRSKPRRNAVEADLCQDRRPDVVMSFGHGDGLFSVGTAEQRPAGSVQGKRRQPLGANGVGLRRRGLPSHYVQSYVLHWDGSSHDDHVKDVCRQTTFNMKFVDNVRVSIQNAPVI